MYHFSVFPLTEVKLMYFAIQSIKTYFSSIRFMAISAGHSLDLHSMHQLYYSLRGIHCTQPFLRLRRPRAPICTFNLYQIQEYIFGFRTLSGHDKRLLWSATLLAFLGYFVHQNMCRFLPAVLLLPALYYIRISLFL